MLLCPLRLSRTSACCYLTERFSGGSCEHDQRRGHRPGGSIMKKAIVWALALSATVCMSALPGEAKLSAHGDQMHGAHVPGRSFSTTGLAVATISPQGRGQATLDGRGRPWRARLLRSRDRRVSTAERGHARGGLPPSPSGGRPAADREDADGRGAG